ncbi:MAG: hypothetical protein ABMB14_32625 [Myxococcota bacterium]
MPGARPNNPRVGDRAEYYANFLLSRIATAVQVPRQEDFGIDFMGALLRREGQSLREGLRFNVQVKSNTDLLSKPFGALRNGMWPHHEVHWLLGLDPYPVPLTALFVGVTDLQGGSLDLYTTANMFHARSMAGYATEVLLAPNDVDRGPRLAYAFAEDLPYTKEQLESAPPPGDGKRWVVRLRNPVARLTGSMVGGPDHAVAPVVATLERWIHIDQLNRVAAFLRIPCSWYFETWETNVPPAPHALRPSVYSGSGGVEDLPYMEEVLSPMLLAVIGNYDRARDLEGIVHLKPAVEMLARRAEARRTRKGS